MNKKQVYIIIPILLITGACLNRKQQPVLTAKDVVKVVNKMTDLMVHDVTNPPLAARFYTYSCLAAYEVISENTDEFKGMYGKLKQYPNIKKPASSQKYDYRLTALFAMLEVASKLQPSGKQLTFFEQELADSCKNIGFDDEIVKNSRDYAQFIGRRILAYAKSDNYNKISNFPRYRTTGLPGDWEPTPPAYMTPVEPYFNTIRPMTLDSASQFKLPEPVRFSTKKNSVFFKFLRLNYKKGADDLTAQEKVIANFWDCNPFAVQNEGHMLIGLKKISPGAHWMGITGIACGQSKADFAKTIKVHTVVAIGLLDAFIYCWDEKYRTNRIRPETAIRQLIDPNWRPFLQTPPFPEYLSGHSIVSATSAAILTHYIGDKFRYTDNIEAAYGVPPKSFSSFNQAANEAAISRFYGGIHFMDAINNGLEQGTKIGIHVLATVH